MKSNLLLLLVSLACPTLGIAGSAPQQPSSGLVWQQSERTNASEAFTFSRFTLVGKFLSPLPDAVPNRPALVVDCIPGINYFPMVAVRYHTDNAKDENQKWSPGLDKTSASIDKDLLKKILRSRTFAITADDNRGSQVTMQFDMPDPTLVEEACHVDEHKR
jgi:hypothetical protein